MMQTTTTIIISKGGVSLTPPVVIECHKTLNPALYRIKRAIERKPVPRPPCPLKRKEPFSSIPFPNVSCLYFNPSLCKALMPESPVNNNFRLIFAVFQDFLRSDRIRIDTNILVYAIDSALF